MISILVAGIGNIFNGDDAFGVEVVRLLAQRSLPAGVKVIDFVLGESLVEALIEGVHGGEHPREERFARIGERDPLDAAVLGGPLPGDVAGVLHPVEVMGQGRVLDPDRGRDFTLHGVVGTLEGGDDEPGGKRTPGGDEFVVEGPVEQSPGSCHIEADRVGDGLHTRSVARRLDAERFDI